MIRGFVKDESGMTLPLAMIMIALIGVMGAGLLTFVMRDIDSVAEVNRGQNALDIAEAGVQAAKAHLRVDSFRQHYDTNSSNDCAEGPRVGNDNWSKATQSWTSATKPGECSPNGTLVNNPADNLATPWPEQYGVTKTFAGGRFHVTIECFVQSGDTAISPNPCNGGAGAAPESSVQASERKFFKITSTGYDNPTGSGTVRRVEAIYTTAKRTYAPIAYWTPKNITFDGTKCVSKMSFFAGGSILGVKGDNSACGPNGFIANRTTPPDAIYADWYAPPYNTTRRVNASGTPITGVGFGAIQGVICASSPPSGACPAGDLVADGYNDYDSTTGTKGQNKRMVATSTNPTAAGQIALPFDPGNAISDPSSVVDPGLVEEMRVAALEQGNYSTSAITMTTWPAKGATVFVDGANVIFKVNSTPKAEGVMIVRNGNFEFNNASNGFKGVIIVIGDGTTTGNFEQKGGVQLDGYIAASGNITIRGNVSPSTTIDYTNLNSFYDIKLWSWRELYS